ncbi:PRC-barrel domain-containing protein [Dehalobacterium formicoaceticum]|uniref:PRC-barrel domain-containing protein n=1 Tax=Dehalobacterium formicoaceticum TaxID=51515 RepID=A0ABT1Y392_9FIRM|nr:PRC-barrel domain-containing protein [Dehalobacterium formicoaceticum]MCR6545344.1 PRC-barrel domain-containing protein [Dehalobacterium formicoaceticum]
MEKPSKKALSLPVLSVHEGEHLGQVKSIVIDPVSKVVAAFVITKKRWLKEEKIIPFYRVNQIGDHAIVIDKAGTVEKVANLPQISKLMKNPMPIINSRVVSTSGKLLGHVEEFWFDETGKITKYEIGGKLTEGLWKGKILLSGEDVVTIGKDVIMVADGAENRLISGDNHIQKTMSDLKTATGKIWGSTVETSQKLGHAIVSSINKLAEEERKEKQTSEELPPEEQIVEKEEIFEEEIPEEELTSAEILEEDLILLDDETPEQQEEAQENTSPPKET